MKRLKLALTLVAIACLVSCGKKGIGKITAPKLGGAGQWVRSSGPLGTGQGGVIAFAASGTMKNLFALKDGTGVWRSTDNGANWVSLSSGLASTKVYSLTSNGETLFAGGRGVWRSTDNGATWQQVVNGPGNQLQVGDFHVTAFAVSGTTVFAAGNRYYCNCSETDEQGCCWVHDAQVFRSTDNGETWTPILFKDGYGSVTSIAISGTSIFIGLEGEGVFVGSTTTSDPNANWTPANDGLTSWNVRALAVSGGALFAGTDGDVLRYVGSTWVPSGLAKRANALAVIGSDLLYAPHGR